MKNQLGVTMLSISLIVGSIILGNSIAKNAETIKSANYLPQRDTKISGAIGASAIPMNITTNANDVTFKTELTVGAGKTLLIEPANNKTVVKIEGKNISATFFHVGRLLEVEFENGNGKNLMYFNNPDSWRVIE